MVLIEFNTRLERDTILALRAFAEKQGIAPAKLVRRWIEEKLSSSKVGDEGE